MIINNAKNFLFITNDLPARSKHITNNEQIYQGIYILYLQSHWVAEYLKAYVYDYP